MSETTDEIYNGFATAYDKPPFPNLYADSTDVTNAAYKSIEALEYKVNQYGEFLQRTDPMPRAIKAANRIMDYLLFELAYRDGVYDVNLKIAEEVDCE